jgi:hypothetical protein
MLSRSPALWFVPVLLAGCLQEGPPPVGVHLFHSQTLAAPGFFKVGDEQMIRFEDRIAPATATKGGVSDLWITSYDGKNQRKVVANRSDYWGEQGPFNAGDRYYMVDETLVPTNGGMARTATLLRLGPTLDEEMRFEGIWAYQRYTVPLRALVAEPQDGQTCPGFPSLQNDCPQLLYERPALPGQSYPTLFLWDGQDEIPIGADAGSFQLQTMGNGSTYFIFESQRTLARLLRPQNVLELVRANVSRFSVSGDEHYVAVAVADEGKSKTVILDLATGAEIPLMRPNPTSWGGFGSDTFFYSQSATGGTPAELHALTLSTGDDQFETLPSPLVDLAGVLDRPDSDERLLMDSQLHGLFTRRSDFVPLRPALAGPLLTPSFSPDGKYLIYVTPAAPTLYDTKLQGPLMFQDADQVEAPPSIVSPAGLLVGAQNGSSYFFADGDAGKILVFWAHLGRASSDLYFADYASGGLPTNLRLMAKAILSVSISAHSLFGVINMSQQDGVGDLVYVDFDQGTQTLYAHAVADAAERGGSDLSTSYAAYIVRGRADSDRSGLWLTTLAPPPDGGSI